MGLAEIVQRIEADALKESAGIVEAAESKARAILEGARADAFERREKALADARQRADRERAHTLAQARLAARNVILGQKRAALDETEVLAWELCADLDDAKYRAVFAAAVAKRAMGHETVAFDGSDATRFGPAFIDEANGALVAAGKPGGLTPAGAVVDLGGAGLILIGDGTEERVTPAALVAEARAAAEAELAALLFAADGPAPEAVAKKRGRKAR